jgi:hypothetical protein
MTIPLALMALYEKSGMIKDRLKAQGSRLKEKTFGDNALSLVPCALCPTPIFNFLHFTKYLKKHFM